MESNLVLLIDGEGTRIDPHSGKLSCLDLTLISPNLAAKSSWEATTQNLGSDHFHILIGKNSTPESATKSNSFTMAFSKADVKKYKAYDIKKVFSALHSLLNKSPTMLPVHTSVSDLADRFASFFKTKVNTVRESLLVSNEDLASCDEPCNSHDDFAEFHLVSNEDIRRLIMASPNKSCQLDALPVWLIKENISILLPFIVSIVNSSLNAGLFPPTLKEAILMPLIKKPNLDRNILTNYRPVSNVPFLSKIIEKAALEQLKNHLDAFDLHDDFQSAYRKHHSTETALLRLKNDVLQGIDGKEAVFVVLLDLSSAFFVCLFVCL